MTREEKLSGGFSFTEDPLEDVDDLEDLNKLRDDLGKGAKEEIHTGRNNLGNMVMHCHCFWLGISSTVNVFG